MVVDSENDCYRALGIVHQLWSPIPRQFDDYIANPKENMYQALHTTVICQGGQPLEVQIKTHEMHQVAEYGVAAHWRYKEGRAKDLRFEEKMTWMRQLLEWQREAAGHRRIYRVGQAGHLSRPGVCLYPQRGHRGTRHRLHAH